MENNFENKLENLETPKTNFIKHQDVFKIGLMNAKKSSRIGIIFILIPALFILIVYIKYQFLIRIDYPSTMNSFLLNVDHANYFKWIVPIVFIGLPVIAIFVNLLAVTHFYINKTSKELIITLQYRLKNIVVMIISKVILLTFIIFIIVENVHFK